jgi:ABC-2 type transport system permease protein
VTADVALRHLGRLTQGAVVLVLALTQVGVDWTAGRAVWLVVSIGAASLIFAGVWIAFATISFWLIDSFEVTNSFTYGGNVTASYPINIFGEWLRRLVIFVIPIAFISYFPTLYLLDKDDPLGLPSAFQFASPLVAAAVLLAGGLLWRFAVRRYRSVGA